MELLAAVLTSLDTSIDLSFSILVFYQALPEPFFVYDQVADFFGCAEEVFLELVSLLVQFAVDVPHSFDLLATLNVLHCSFSVAFELRLRHVFELVPQRVPLFHTLEHVLLFFVLFASEAVDEVGELLDLVLVLVLQVLGVRDCIDRVEDLLVLRRHDLKLRTQELPILL